MISYGRKKKVQDELSSLTAATACICGGLVILVLAWPGLISMALGVTLTSGAWILINLPIVGLWLWGLRSVWRGHVEALMRNLEL